MDYGMRTSKKGESALSQDYANILMSTRFPFAKIDQTVENSFRTTNITFLNNPPEATKTLIASFDHGYTYKPQVWGLWEITWGSDMGGASNLTYNGYGSVSTAAAVPSATLWYEWNETTVYLYAYWSDPFDLTPLDLTGTTASLTTYIFVDDLTQQDYTS